MLVYQPRVCRLLTIFEKTSLTPHVPLLLLHTSSALSHIFPEIRLDTARLVQLFLDHIPTHVISSWPTSTSTILEGLRLTVGLGGDKATGSAQSGRLGAQGKLVALRTILAFVRAALDKRAGDGDGDDEDADEVATLFATTFGGVNGDMRKGKGKAKQLDGDSDTWGILEGYLVDGDQWGMEAPTESWEVGRLETETSLAGKGADVEAVAVSSAQTTWYTPYRVARLMECSNCTLGFTPYSWPHSSKPRRPLFRLLPPPSHRPIKSRSSYAPSAPPSLSSWLGIASMTIARSLPPFYLTLQTF